MRFQRIQFTPDLLPADIVAGHLQPETAASLVSKKGPIFANLVLADEINRAPPRCSPRCWKPCRNARSRWATRRMPCLTIPGDGHANPSSTKNLCLPEAQLDRFMLMVKVGYPSKEDERAIMDRNDHGHDGAGRAGWPPPRQIAEARLGAEPDLHRPKERSATTSSASCTPRAIPSPTALAELRDFIEYGASPRASIYLNWRPRAHAFLRRRGYVTPEDIKAIAWTCSPTGVILTYEAEAEEITSEQVVRKLFKHIEVP